MYELNILLKYDLNIYKALIKNFKKNNYLYFLQMFI